MTNKKAAITIIRSLCGNGYEALLAGGCVRDMLLGRIAKDYDVATNALPEAVAKLFKRTINVGAKFGVVIVLLEGRQVEVATFRTESGYSDGRHPDHVEFTTAAEDAGRRDFTVNGMFYDPLKDEVIDYVNGRGDLKSRIIRTIGKPEKRFGEDYLRLLRAVRFSAQLGFSIEPQTWSAVCDNAKNITKISGERIAMELEGILTDSNREVGIKALIESGLAEHIFPEFCRFDVESVVSVLSNLAENIDFALGLAALFSQCPSEFGLESCKSLKMSRKLSRHLKFLLMNRGKLINEKMGLAELKVFLANPYFEDLFNLQKAIQKALGLSSGVLIKLRRRIKGLGDVELKPEPLLNGHELIQLGTSPGRTVGRLANELYIAQLEGTVSSRKQAEQWVGKWLQRQKELKD